MVSEVKFLYSGLRVRSVARSLAFYRKLGFRPVARGTMEHGGVWVHLRFPRSWHRLELNYYPPGNRFYEPIRRGTEFDHFGFYAPDPVAWKRRALRAGGRLVEEFVEGRFRLIYVRDPDGNWLEAFGPASPRRRRAGSHR
jgi:catechol 2,3-dioxygenase-like lactoylglutathione lyase family enzyme